MKRALALALAFALPLLATSVLAQDAAPAPAAAPPLPCSAEEYRQFDFWVGQWQVKDANGSLQGTNRIDSILGGCALQEHWEGGSGSIGESYNIYDRQTRKWHQTWVDNGGLLLQIQGGITGNAMIMRGTGKARDGASVDHMITWTPLEDGRVKQHWQSSRDGGETWNDAFVGFYARVESAD